MAPTQAPGLRTVLIGLASIVLFLSVAGKGWNGPFVRPADIAGWTAATAANVRAGKLLMGRWHQSPLPYWITAAAYRVFGISETVTRVIPFALTLCAGLLVFSILKRIESEELGLIGMAAFFFYPPTVVFAMSNNHIVFSVPAILLAFYVWLRWPERTRLQVWCTLLAMWCYWHAYFLPIFFAWQKRDWRWLLLPAASAAAFLAFTYAMNPSEPLEIVGTALERGSAGGWNPKNALFVVLGEAYNLSGALVTLLVIFGFVAERRPLLIGFVAPPVLYWTFMARIATLEPMFNAFMLAPAVAFAIAYAGKYVPNGFAGAAVVLMWFAAVNQAPVWQKRLYDIETTNGYNVTREILKLTKPGDTIYEDGHEIGPGRLEYYAWDRNVVKLPTTDKPARYTKGPAYLVTVRDRSLFGTVKEVAHFSPWTIYFVAGDKPDS